MADYRLTWSIEGGGADLSLEDDDVASDEGLRTAVLLSLFLDRRAEAEDVLPGGDDDRRGWWADEFAEVEQDRIGSRLWLLDRAKRLPDVVQRTEAIAREALAWMIDDRVASAVDVEVEADDPVLSLVVTIHRPQGDQVAYRFSHTWEGEEANAV